MRAIQIMIWYSFEFEFDFDVVKIAFEDGVTEGYITASFHLFGTECLVS